MADPDDIPLSEASADLNLADREQSLRENVAGTVTDVFVKTNIAVLGVLAVMLVADWVLMSEGLQTADQRLVDREILMTLIGATTVQLGAIMYSLGKYLFPTG